MGVPTIDVHAYSKAVMEADRDREMVDTIVKNIEAEERADQEQYLRSR